jgi:hypothetical protein
MIESLSATSRWKTAIKSAVPFLIPMYLYMYVRGILSCVFFICHNLFIFKLDRSDQNWMETLKMAPLFWNYLFPETHVADQLDWK